MNTEYLLWLASLVVVASAALLWLATGDVPDLPAEPTADDLDPGAGERRTDHEVPSEIPAATSGPAPQDGAAEVD